MLKRDTPAARSISPILCKHSVQAATSRPNGVGFSDVLTQSLSPSIPESFRYRKRGTAIIAVGYQSMAMFGRGRSRSPAQPSQYRRTTTCAAANLTIFARWLRVIVLVSVVDGIHGQPANGVRVQLSRSNGNATASAVSGYTNEEGQFRFVETSPYSGGVTYSVELDVDRYFSVIGIASFYRRTTLMFRVLNANDEYRIRFLITPFSEFTDCMHGRAEKPSLRQQA